MAHIARIGTSLCRTGQSCPRERRFFHPSVDQLSVQSRPLAWYEGSSLYKSSTGLVCMARRERDPIIAPVIQMGENNEDVVDLNSHLLRNRIIFLGERINDQVAVKTVATLLALNSLSTEDDIKLYINCAAGSSYSVVSILDTMDAIKAPISTVAFGMVGGNAVQILAAGTKGKRFSMPNTRIMMQQPNGGAQGSADEVNIQTTELNRTMRMMYQFLSKSTGLCTDRIEEECDRENFLSPKEAVGLGIIDGIVE